jgi:4'-phosphopantetheinyl transferase EntD
MKYYLAGGLYKKGEDKIFGLVHPSFSDIPYVRPEKHPDGCDSTRLHLATRHHASLYLISADCKSLARVHAGDFRDKTDPKKVSLSSTHQSSVMQAVEATIKELVGMGITAEEAKAE